MTTRGIKGYRVKQSTENGKIKITLEPIPTWRKDASAQIRQRKSKRIRVQRRPLLSLFSGKRGDG